MNDSSLPIQLEEWEKNALEKFAMKINDKEKPFPCIPATIGFSVNQLCYGFIGDPRETSTIYELAELVSSFTEVSRDFGNYTSLIVFYETPEDMKATYTVVDYEQLFWQQISGLCAIDYFEWPHDIPTDPHNPLWEFCYHGEKYFMYCATPAHLNRKSRHFEVILLAITPRWVLQEFNKSQKFAQSIKTQIRKRLSNYDSAPIHPDLNSYGSENNFEWKQYFLRDDDTSLSKCPFHRGLKE
nr:YqcI/YcgG family protein [Neobacillus bataviensis]